MKNILIPTDFSCNAWNAMQYAAALLQHEPCRYVLVNAHYVAPPMVDNITADYIDLMSKDSMEELTKVLDSFQGLTHHAESCFEQRSPYGELELVIDRLLEEDPADLIIMGTKGASGVAEVLIGTTAYSLIKTVNCPIICVPENARFTNPKKILFAADFKPVSSDNIFAPMLHITRQFQAEIMILNVLKDEKTMSSWEEATEGLGIHEYLDEASHSFHSSSGKDIAKCIEDFTWKNRIDLVVMLKREHSFWETIFNASMTKKMAFHTNTPLLILHDYHDG